MLASPTSRWSAGAVLLTLLVLVGSWFLLIGPRRADAGTLREQTTSAQSQASALQTQIAQLKSEFADLPKRRAELAAIKAQLPPAADVPALVRNLQDYAAAAGVSLDSIAPGTPVIHGGAAAGTSGAAQPGQVVEIPIQLAVAGDYFEDALFVKSLQTKLTRAYLISGLTSTTQDAGSVNTTTTSTPAAAATTPPTSIALQITGSVFVLLDDTTTLQSVDEQAKAAAANATTPAARASAVASAEASAG
jgi:type IV pilus assembly protein PilO